MGVAALLAVAMLTGSATAEPLSLPQCTRVTHVSHGGEAMHRDLGEGRVIWLDWWSQEGSSHDLIIAECASGQTLIARTAEENIRPRPPFHKTEKAWQIIEAEHRAARVFATLPRIATALDGVGKDLKVLEIAEESCACAALYPEARGDKRAFVLAPEEDGS